jgi:putative transposase
VVDYIDQHRDRWGVGPICEVLQFAPSTYYDNKTRPPSRRSVDDAELKKEIERVYEENFSCYGAEKVWWQLHREGIACGRDRVARLMRELGIFGATRAKGKRTTVPAKEAQPLPADLVQRNFKATEPNRLWVNDLTYVPIWSGFAYTAFVIDAFSQRIVGWKVSTSLETGLALDALEMAIWSRRGESLEGLVHHSDRGSQYLAIRYTARLEEAGMASSVGSKGDSFDNALAETINGLYKAELIRRRGPWRTAAQVERATAEWVAWWNNHRLHGSCGRMPPAEYEADWYQRQATAA